MVGVRSDVGVLVPDELMVMVSVGGGVTVAVGDTVDDTEPDGEPVPVRVCDHVSSRVTDSLSVLEIVAGIVPVMLPDRLSVPEDVTEPVGEVVMDRVIDREPDRESEMVKVCPGVGVSVPDKLMVVVVVFVAERVGGRDTDGVMVMVVLPVCEVVTVTVSVTDVETVSVVDGDDEYVNVFDLLPVTDDVGCIVRVSVAVFVMDNDDDKDRVPVAVNDLVPVPVAEPLAEPLTVMTLLGDDVEVRVPVKLPEALGVPAERVRVLLSVSVPGSLFCPWLQSGFSGSVHPCAFTDMILDRTMTTIIINNIGKNIARLAFT